MRGHSLALASELHKCLSSPCVKLQACLRRIREGLLLKCYSAPLCQPPLACTIDNVLLAKTAILGEGMVLPGG
jgi:hypothetical protein